MFLSIQNQDIVDIILPATSCSEKEILAIKEYVKNELGLIPRIQDEENLIFNSDKLDNEFPKNSPKDRFLQLEKAIKSKDSKIIWCARGGYGSGDLLPFLKDMEVQNQDKLFIGFSDIVSLSTFFQDRWNWQIICAPVLLQLARNEIEKEAEAELKDLIFGKKTELSYDLESLNNSEAQINSEIAGGCLSVLAGHFGSDNQINFDQRILFLEDEGEDGERLDRYFRQIIEVILKDKKTPAAILLGNFLQANPHGTPKAKNIEIAINNFIKRLDELNLEIPVFQSKENNLGHSNKMRPLILGKKSEIIKSSQGHVLVTKS